MHDYAYAPFNKKLLVMKFHGKNVFDDDTKYEPCVKVIKYACFFARMDGDVEMRK